MSDCEREKKERDIYLERDSEGEREGEKEGEWKNVVMLYESWM